MPTVHIETDARALSTLAPEWESLLARSAAPEPMLSPAWLGAWWGVFGPHDGRALRLVVVRDGPKLVGLLPLTARTHAHRPGIPLRRLELLGTGEREQDEVCSEYVGALAERGAEEAVAQALADALADGRAGAWDELVLTGMSGEGLLPVLLARALDARGLDARIDVTGVAPHVPLPASYDDYLARLPGSRRYLLRRAVRDLTEWAGGALAVERVEGRADLARGRAVLHALHAERWRADGEAGVFASEKFRAFHDAVLPALLERGELDLSWLTARGEPVAVLYNLVAGGKVYFYQSGRRADLPRGLRPGLAAHALAIERAIARGLREYDFLQGTTRYKLDLALAARPLVRLRAARPTLAEAARRAASFAQDHARALRDAVRRWRAQR